MSERWPDKLIIGLTGNIATGKSTVLRLAEERAALALDADSFVHHILAHDPEAQQAIIAAFGAVVRDPYGAINRAAVAAIVFKDESALEQLERILHPRVRRLLLRRIDRSPNEVVLIEAIKLLEGGLAAECDEIWVTRCPVETQVDRLMTYRQLDRETALIRIQSQSDQALKVAAADVVIDTGGSLASTAAQFDLAWARLQRRRSSQVAQAKSPRRASDHTIGSDLVGSDAVGTGPPYHKLSQEVVAADSASSPVDLVQAPEHRDFNDLGSGISVRRARPEDIETMVQLVAESTHGIVTLAPAELLSDLGERGYLLGRQDETVTAIGGWNAENLVATIDCLYVYPPEALAVTGAAILREIEITANELICEVIIALPGELAPRGTRRLLRDRGFVHVDPTTLPRPWQAALEGRERSNAAVMLKILRDTRQVRVRTLKE